jgi:hypothetical protein
MSDKRPNGMRSNAENILRATLGEAVEYDTPNSPVEYYLVKLKEAIEAGGGGGGFTPTQAQLAAMNSGITSERVNDLEGIAETDDDFVELANGARLYISSTAPTGNIPDGSVGVGW